MGRIYEHRHVPLATVLIGSVLVIGIAFTSPPNATLAQTNPKHASDSAPATVVAGENVPQLVGREVCRECHAENFRLHSGHGHASTFRAVKGSDIVTKLSGTTYDAGNDYGTYRYSADGDGELFATLPSRFDELNFPLQYLLGSGIHAQTMLTLMPGPEGKSVGIEHRVSCYRGDRFALTPAHSQKKPRNTFEYFGDSMTGEPLDRCIYCHTTRADVLGDSIQDLVANVNCEKCHGPGSEHVRLARIHEKPPPFSVGRETWDAESELQLCGDCHRLPRSVTEKEIRNYPDLLVRFQPVGLVRSRCYLDSGRQLKCSSCHNPHQSVKEPSAADHVEDCLACHQQNNEEHVACPVEPETGCIECHMPAIEVDQGLRFHDHWIRVRKD